MKSSPTNPIRSLRQAGAVLRARRAARKISQRQLGEMTGTAQSTISDIENGVVSVSLDVYLRLLEALGAELSATDRLADRGQL
jgi:HTH-type transcriptional regulator / antitoxin HipB